jgi:hypothetical protein
MAVPVQAGTAVVLGFGSLAISGYFSEDGTTYSKTYDNKEIIKDQNGATRTKIRMDKSTKIGGTFLADLSTTPEITVDDATFSEGDTVSITPVDGSAADYYEVDECSGAMSAGALKLALSLIKEDSMDYTPA